METACPPGANPGPDGECHCVPGALEAHRADGSLICSTPPEPRCLPWEVGVCVGGMVGGQPTTVECRCVPINPPVSAMACEIRVQYSQGDPAHPYIVQEMGPWCDLGGIQLALATVLARLLAR